jgi:hypothetical protein
MISLFFGCCFSFLTLPTPNIQCQIQGERKFLKGRQLFLFGDMSDSKKYSPSDTLFYMSSQSWFLVDLVSFLEEVILCFLTLFSQVYFFRYLIKTFKVSICITLMYMIDLLLVYIVCKKTIMDMWTLYDIYVCSDAYSQDTCCMYISHVVSLVICTSSGGVQGSSYMLHVFFKAFIQTSAKSLFEALMYVVINYQKGGD